MARRRNEEDAASSVKSAQLADSIEDAEAAYVAAREAYITRLTTPRKPRFEAIAGYQPDWFTKAYRAEMEKTDFLDPAYLQTTDALAALRDGDFGPLAVLLKERAELPVLIRRELFFMIEGDAEQSGGYRLALKNHPDIDGRKTEGRAKLMRQHHRDYAIAIFIAMNGGNTGQLEAAMADAKAKFSLGRSTLHKIWAEYQDEVASF